MRKKHPHLKKSVLKYILFSKNFSKNRHLLNQLSFWEKKLAEGGGTAKTAHPLCFFVLILPSRKDYSAKGGGGGVERVGDDDGGRAEDDGAGVAGRRREQGNC